MASSIQAAGREARLEYELPPFTWDEFLVDSILEARLKELGLETVVDLGVLAVYALENHLSGSTGLRARRLLFDFKDTLERSFVFRPRSTTLELSSSHSDESSSYECRVKDDGAALWWRVDLDCEEFEEISPRVTSTHDLLSFANVRAFTSWQCRTPADFLSRSSPPSPPDLTVVKDALSSLTPRQAKIMKLRFGLEDDRSRTLEAVGREFNVTRQGIRQTEGTALRKLRHPSRSKKLSALFEQLYSVGEAYAAKVDTVLSADAFTPATDNVAINPKGTLALLTAVFGERSQRPTLDGFESRIFQALAGALGRLPNERELTAPPADLVRSVMADEVVQNALRRWPRFSPYGRLKLLAPGLLRSGGLRLNSRRQRLSALVSVLEEDDQPLHFSEIAERANRRLPSKIKMTERNVHAWLGRYTDNFVWAGLGKYGLKEWDIGRRVDRDDTEIPEELLPTRRRGIADEIVLLLLEAAEPLPLANVEDYILSRFSVNSSSVQAAIEQDTAGRFILGADGRVSLAQWDRAASTGGRRVKRYKSNRAELAEVVARAHAWLDEVRVSLGRGCVGVSDDLLMTWTHVARALELQPELVNLSRILLSRKERVSKDETEEATRGSQSRAV